MQHVDLKKTNGCQTLEETKNKLTQDLEAAQKQAEAAKMELQEKLRDATVERELRTLLEGQLRERQNEYVAVCAQMEAVRSDSKSAERRHHEDIERMQNEKQAIADQCTKNDEKWKVKVETLEVRRICRSPR